MHFKYGKHCWAYSGNGAICGDCGLTTYIDEDGKKSYGTRSVSFKGNYDAHQAESDGDKQLDLAVKRTKMSALRTGLALTTFAIVMWNVWTNKKQEKDIADIMAEI